MRKLLRSGIESYSLASLLFFVKLSSISPSLTLIHEFKADPHDSDLIEVRRLRSLNLAPSVEIRATIKSQKDIADESAAATRI